MAEEDKSELTPEEKERLSEVARRRLKERSANNPLPATTDTETQPLTDKEKALKLCQQVIDKLLADPNRQVSRNYGEITVSREVNLRNRASRLKLEFKRGGDYDGQMSADLIGNAHEFLPPPLNATLPNQASVIIKSDGSLEVASGLPIDDYFNNQEFPPPQRSRPGSGGVLSANADNITGTGRATSWRKPSTIEFDTAFASTQKVFDIYLNPNPQQA